MDFTDASARDDFARLLRRFRVAAGLTQEELAERSGVSKRAVGNLERGVTRPQFRTVEMLAAGLGLRGGTAWEFVAAGRARSGPAVEVFGVPLTSTGTGREALPIVVHVLLLDEDRVLLLRRADTGMADGMYGPPAARLKCNETVVDAARHEVADGVGVNAAGTDLSLVATAHRRENSADGIDLFFLMTRWSGTPRIRRPHRYDDLSWRSRDWLPENTLGSVRLVLDGGHVLSGGRSQCFRYIG